MKVHGKCRWCGHPKADHDGRVAQSVKDDPKYRGVRWTKTACSVGNRPWSRYVEDPCACRTYVV